MNKIPVPESVIIQASNRNGKTTAIRRVTNPLLNDKRKLFANYMFEVNMIDETEPFVKPTKYKFNLVQR